MTRWVERIMQEFSEDLARLWLVTDPDAVLLDEKLLADLRIRGFEVCPFMDSIAFRADYEARYRAAWDRGEKGPAPALILQLRSTPADDLPWDYRQQGRTVSLSLQALFPKLSYAVVRQLGNELLPELFAAQEKHASQPLGDTATKDFVLTHVFRMSPYLITRQEDLWDNLLRLHSKESALPPVLAQHVGKVIGELAVFKRLPVVELFMNRSYTLRVVQAAWYRYLASWGIFGTRVAEPPLPDYGVEIDLPFDHPYVRGHVTAMFLDGALHPLQVDAVPESLPEWATVGVIRDPAALRNLIVAGSNALLQELPAEAASQREWTHFARKMAEVLSRFHVLEKQDAEAIKGTIRALQRCADERLREWVGKHYTNLIPLPVVNGPIMVQHIPRYLAIRRERGEAKIALLVFDGLSLDQWVQLRESVLTHTRQLVFDEKVSFAWLPTLTSVSRQALFSGLRPHEFRDSIESTSKEPAQWSRFWQEHHLRPAEVFYRKSIKRKEDLPELEEHLSAPQVKVAALVVDTVDHFVHGAVLGKRDIAARINTWCESGFVERLFTLLLDQGFHVYVTSDHGNVEAIGSGRINQGVVPELRGERVRIYRSEALLAESAAAHAHTFRLDIPGLPEDLWPLFAEGRGAFLPVGEHAVTHGGMSVEELFVPFIKVSYTSTPA